MALNPTTGKLDCVGTSGSVTISTNTSGANSFIFNQSALQSGATFSVSSGSVQGPFFVIQSDNDSSSGPMIISSTFTKEADINRYHSAYLYGIVPDPTNLNGEFVITMSSQTPFKPDKYPDYSLRPEIVMQQNNGATGASFISLRADTNINLPNNVPTPGTFTVYPSTCINSGQLQAKSSQSNQVPLEVLGASGQTGHLQEWYSGSGVLVSSVGADGNFYVSTITIAKAIKWPDGTIQVSSPTAGGGGGGTPAGSTGDVQFNTGGAFASDTGNLFWNSSSHQLGIGTGTTTSPLTIVGSAFDSDSLFNLTNTGSTPGKYLGFFKSLAPNMPAGTSFGYYYTWGVADSTYDRAFVNFNYVGHNNTSNSVDFGFFGIASVFSYFANNQVGIGTGSGVNPGATLHIQTDLSTTKGLLVEGSSSQSADLQEWQNSSAAVLADISSAGHINSKGSTPSISSCGTTPNGSVVGSDNAGTITVGGGAVTACTLTFATAYTNAPTCVISDNSTAITGDISAISNSAFTASFSLSIGGGKIYYICIGSD